MKMIVSCRPHCFYAVINVQNYMQSSVFWGPWWSSILGYMPTTLSISLPPGLPVRMSLSSSHPALTPIKSTLPPMEAPLSAPSVFWSPSCPPWTSSSAACQSLRSPDAQVRPLLPGTWACNRWILEQSLSGLNHTALSGPGQTGYVLYEGSQQIPVVTWLLTAVTCSDHCD